MSTVESYAKDIKQLVAHVKEFKLKIDTCCGGSFAWGVEQILDSYLSLFDRFCPYYIGDRVQLKRDCDIPNSAHGWYHCRHFLVKGAKATVRERGYVDGKFTFYIEFDDESWIDSDGIMYKKDDKNKHVFHFGEDALQVIDK